MVGIALVAALGIRLLGAEAFRIPTSSMEKTLLVGDFVLVSKLHYGARTPITLGLPFTDWYLDAELPSVRLPGFGAVRRGDVIVFNLPTERRPVDRKTPFIKRVVGVPGDTVALVGKEVRVNGEAVPLAAGMQQGWRVVLDPAVPFSPESFRRLGVRAPVERASGGEWLLRMTPAQAEEDLALRAAALSALLQMDGERARPLLHELARKPGECAAHLRTQAVFMIASSGGDDAATIDLLLDLALRDPDPSPEVRRAAVQWLAQSRRPEAIDGLLQILRAGQEGSELTHLLVSTLGQSRDPRAGEVLREVATDPAADASLRRVAIIWLARHDVRADGQLLRSLYEELDDPALKQAVFHALTSAHSPGVTEWLQARALDPDEDIEIRTNALFRAAEAGLTAAQLLDIYRGSTHPELRRQAIFALTLNDRGEGGIEALLEIARTETDPDLRRQVIFWLGQSKDPRAADFLMELLRGGGGS